MTAKDPLITRSDDRAWGAAVFAALGEEDRARSLRATADRLRERINADFWLPERECYALALDGDKRPVDALTSNPGHLLWTGVPDDARARRVAERLLAPELFSGWGLRTMATSEGGYNPLSYHNGSVWPHDTSLAIAGLARYGLTDQAATLAGALLAALAASADRRLPELFSGHSTDEAPFPVEYPTANRPQAWATGSVFLLLTAMLGLDAGVPDLAGTPFLPPQVTRLRIDGLRIGEDRRALEVRREKAGARVRRVSG